MLGVDYVQRSVKLIKEVVAAIGNHEMDDLIQEEQNSEYEGVRFNLLKQTYRSRLAKSTPKKQGILSSEISKGKMAIRVYPSWISNLNPSAAKTQKWQVEYFVDLSHKMDLDKLTYLYNF